MKINLGEIIRELRRRNERTQEDLANALGVTAQAISRWESGGGYPDLEIIPAIANYFGISIDQLFGYHGEREAKIDALIAQVDALDLQNCGTDVCLDECLRLLRDGMAEFPGNEKITLRLASLLSETGWIRYGEHIITDSEGFSVHNAELHKKNEYWNEAIKLLEKLISSTADSRILQRAGFELTLLYRNIGAYEKAIAIAETFPDIHRCRENMLTYACDGRQQAEYLGEALLAQIASCAEQLIQALMANRAFENGIAVKTIESAIGLFDVVCTDGNYGIYHSTIAWLYLYLSEHQWRAGSRDQAFASLDAALEHAKARDALTGQKDCFYTAPLLKYVRIDCGEHSGESLVSELPRIWPAWCVPDPENVLKEMQADPRWDIWVEKTRA